MSFRYKLEAQDVDGQAVVKRDDPGKIDRETPELQKNLEAFSLENTQMYGDTERVARENFVNEGKGINKIAVNY